MDVREIMTKAVVTASPNDTARSALLLLEDQHIRHLPVVDDGKLVGMVTDRDLRDYRMPLFEELEHPDKADQLLETPLQVVMQGGVIAVDDSETVRDAIDLMLEYGIGAVPVIDRHSEELIGIVSYVDVLRALRDAS
jgi:acetoin utilization protein AcuB